MVKYFESLMTADSIHCRPKNLLHDTTTRHDKHLDNKRLDDSLTISSLLFKVEQTLGSRRVKICQRKRITNLNDNKRDSCNYPSRIYHDVLDLKIISVCRPRYNKYDAKMDCIGEY